MAVTDFIVSSNQGGDRTLGEHESVTVNQSPNRVIDAG
jgi:hypothetical protein